ncbi:MAG TPA: ATP-binding cassette domain-containing protein [Kofleriaceae bacterium]|jgi:molybdate transport system ATP-binding protein
MSDLRAAMTLSRGELAIDVELVCPPGITCLMGPSGAGKSTILGVLAGLTLPTAGTVRVGDETWLDRANGVDVPVHERRLSYVFQGLALFPHMTAQKNVEYGMHDLPPAQRAEKALALLDRMGVKSLAQRRPRTLSGGERQRVALARALGRQPRLMLLDEPFSALDQALRDQLGALVKDLVAELKIPLLHVTHSLEEAKQLGERIVRIESGRVVTQGSGKSGP